MLNIEELKELARKGKVNVAFIGGLRSGKSTASKVMQSTYGMVPLSFGKRLKEVVAMATEGTPLEGKKNVPLLQATGQGFREFYEDIWVSHVDREFHENASTMTVIDDLRQPNEYKWAVENNFIIIRILTDEDVRYERATKEGDVIEREALNAETESHYSTFDVHFEVTNDGTIEEFERKILTLLRGVMNEHSLYQAEERKKAEIAITRSILEQLPYFDDEGIRGNYEAQSFVISVSNEVNRLTEGDARAYAIYYLYFFDGFTLEEMKRKFDTTEWEIRSTISYIVEGMVEPIKDILGMEELVDDFIEF